MRFYKIAILCLISFCIFLLTIYLNKSNVDKKCLEYGEGKPGSGAFVCYKYSE